MAFLVTQRTREIAIRMALGASDGDMQSMVLKQAARLSIIGGIVGLALAGGISVLFKSLLVGVTPVDPLSFRRNGALFRDRPVGGVLDAGEARRDDGSCGRLARGIEARSSPSREALRRTAVALTEAGQTCLQATSKEWPSRTR